MRSLTSREKWLLASCFAVIFLIANGFAARTIKKNLGGSDSTIRELENELADQSMWLDDAERADAREKWLNEVMPNGSNFGKEQADMLQAIQDDLFDRKLKIEQQSFQEISKEVFFTEVAIRLTVRGDQSAVIEWLTTLQNRDQFQVIKSLNLRIDSKSKEVEPQAICQITLAKWFAPSDTGDVMTDAESSSGGAARS